MIVNLFFIIFAGIAVSYGWGMRGTIIGGEKGAMLPGAFMGLLIAAFSGSQVLSSSPWILAGAGALCMYGGGCMTYGETLGLSMNEPDSPTLKKGLAALFIKGGIWFGIFGGLISMFISAVSGFYKLWQIILFFCLIPVFAVVFYLVFNHPHSPESNRFPKFYFSVKRKECWGGLLGILIEIITFSAVLSDWSALVMTLGSFLTGAVGWVIAQYLQVRAKHPSKNGRRLFEKLHKINAVEAWKLMECSLGAIGGIGCAVTFILTKPLFAEKLNTIDANGLHTYISDSKITYLIAVIYTVILTADSLQYLIAPKKDGIYSKYRKIADVTEFAIYCEIPLLLCMLGAHLIAAITSFPVLLLVLGQELSEKRIKKGRSKPIRNISDILLFVLTAIIVLISRTSFDTTSTVILYSAVYEICFYDMIKIENGKISLDNGAKGVHIYFGICCALVIIMSIFI